MEKKKLKVERVQTGVRMERRLLYSRPGPSILDPDASASHRMVEE